MVVGDGATGRHIALELAATHEVLLATGRSRRVSPERILGKSVFWWMDMVGILRASRETRVGRYLMEADPFPGKALGLGRLRRQDIRVTGRLFHVDGKRVGFTDGETAEVEPCSGRRGTRTTANRWRSPRSRIDAESLPTEAAYRPCPPSPLLSLSPSFRRSDRSDGSLRADFGERHADLLVNVVSPLPTGNRYLGPVESSGGGVGLRY